MNQAGNGYVLGFDYGLARIGVAVGQTLTGSASPLEVLRCRNGQPDWDEVAALLATWKPWQLVVGLPLDSDGTDIEMTAAARRFGGRLHGRFGLPVDYQDERLSSVEAQRRFVSLRQAGAARRSDAGRLDAVAAQIILESWLSGIVEE